MRWNITGDAKLREYSRPYLMQRSSSSALACPFCPVGCIVFFQPRLCHISLTRIFSSYVRPPSSSFPWHVHILLTWSYHFSRFSWSLAPLVVPLLMCSLRILSLLVTPHIHLSILISFTSSRASCPLVVTQVSAPYIVHTPRLFK